MKKSKETIKIKWEKKVEEMKKKADFKYNVLLSNRKTVYEKWWEYEVEKNERKKMAYIRKKEEEYKRKMRNEIREFENKPKREYKTDWPKIKPLQFALKLAQENARLRDTDENGRWRCISCHRLCEWEWLAWGHRYSRKFTNICLEESNINAQCHTCNLTTWPRGDIPLKIKTNDEYDKSIIEKFWEEELQRLKAKIYEFTHSKSKKYDLKKKMPKLIEINEKLWSEKSESFRETHKPYRNWRKIWEEYDKRH